MSRVVGLGSVFQHQVVATYFVDESLLADKGVQPPTSGSVTAKARLSLSA
jgi:hypothetical protein